MSSTSLLFKLKNPESLNKHPLLDIFFKAWIDDSCNNEVSYRLERTTVTPRIVEETYIVDFDRREDAVALRLKGVPSELQHYVEFVA
jgi:hypothetical protein